MKTSQIFESLSPDELENKVLALVWNAKRPMPAVFTSNGDRKQSFCIDYEDIDPKDEYQMASASWHWVSQYMDASDEVTHEQLMMIVRCGEDLMIASYITQRLGRAELIREICSKLTQDNQESWPEDMLAPKVFTSKSAMQWFTFCQEYGIQVAKGKY